MAKRIIFIPLNEELQLIKEEYIEFKWNPGLSLRQKRKNIEALHEKAKHLNIWPILEVSTKSNSELGRKLSAFNLTMPFDKYQYISVESAFQGSKVFAQGGPYKDLYYKTGKEIKRDKRLINSGRLIGFKFLDIEWELEPKTAFYDWLYIKALTYNNELAEELLSFKAFTDIEFNPKKSFNCQARACALYVSLYHRNKLNIVNDKNLFIEFLKQDESYI